MESIAGGWVSLSSLQAETIFHYGRGFKNGKSVMASIKQLWKKKCKGDGVFSLASIGALFFS